MQRVPFFVAALAALPAAGNAQTFEGAYAGLAGGYNMGHAETPTGLGGTGTIDIYGGEVGPYLGYSHTLGNGIVLGGEIGYLWSGADGFQDFGSNANVFGVWGSLEKRAETYLSLHAGREVRPGLLLYGIAGVQSARFHFAYGSVDFGQGVDKDATTGGWHLGVGAAVAISGPVSARLEYKYQDYGGIDWGPDDDLEPRENVIRLGIEVALSGLMR